MWICASLQQLGAGAANPKGSGVQHNDETTDVRPASRLRCAACGAAAEENEAFCTRCGAELKGGQETAATAVPERPVESNWPEPADDPEAPPSSPLAALARSAPARLPARQRFRSNYLVVAAIAAIILLAAGLGVAGFSWQQQRAAHHRSAVKLRVAQHQLNSLRSDLADTRTRLVRSQALSRQQRAILRRTAAVLAKVDPLLSHADQLQQLTTGIESDRDSFSADAGTLVNDLIVLGNALVDAANAAGADVSYLNNDINNVNYEINNVRAEADTLSSSDNSYAAASERFGASATAFTNAVRALQRELRTLPAK